MDIQALLSDLKKTLPRQRVLTEQAQLVPYESDGLTVFRASPRVVVLPETADEVVSIVKLCAQHNVPYLARGSGTSLSGGATPIEGGVVIALNRLNRVLRYSAEERICVVEPGVVNLKVSQVAAADGLYYAPDPSSGPICTLGGNVAYNSGGAHCLKYGMTSNHVLGMKVVLPDGELVELGGSSLESVGPDLCGMFNGSEGLFGIALEITLRLLPKPAEYRTMIAAYHSLAAAGDGVARIVASGLLPGAMEIMDALSMEAATAAVGVKYPDGAAAVLIVELEGPELEVVAEEPRLIEIIEASGAYQIDIARSAEQRASIWKGRKSVFSAVGRLTPDYIVQDGVVPRSKLGVALAEIERLSQQYEMRVANVFHAGDGNLHPLIMFDNNVSGALHQAEALAGEILRMCVRLGGAITGEHGVGIEKLAYLSEQYGEQDYQFMHELRRSIDPLELANRGKMLPAAEAPSLSHVGPHPLESQGVIFRE